MGSASNRVKVGFIGLGMMGYPMASRLVSAGHDLFVLDSDEARTTQFQDEHRANCLSDVTVTEIDVLITMLPNSSIVEAVLLGKEGGFGWAHKLLGGTTVIDMSSSEPARSRNLGHVLSKLNLNYLDAPVSGASRRPWPAHWRFSSAGMPMSSKDNGH
jgi:3-hydroxyisobutyrate dehydrogenase